MASNALGFNASATNASAASATNGSAFNGSASTIVLNSFVPSTLQVGCMSGETLRLILANVLDSDQISEKTMLVAIEYERRRLYCLQRCAATPETSPSTATPSSPTTSSKWWSPTGSSPASPDPASP